MFSVRGRYKNVLRFVPPFTTTDAQLDQATEILEGAIRKALA
jgi:4-aminobutyrate aminotransferase-like enzyme